MILRNRCGIVTATPPNKELKLTKPCAIGASQLSSSVRPTRKKESRVRGEIG
jgi:hypothetical protein